MKKIMIDKAETSPESLLRKNRCRDIIGANLLKYYHRAPNSKYKPMDIVCEPEAENWISISADKRKVAVPEFTSTGTQTDYRESETQTDPWDPPYETISTEKEPQIMCLKKLTYGKGLPVTALEVHYASKMLLNRTLLQDLEKNEKNEDTFRKRRDVMRDQLRNDWGYKVAIQNQKQEIKLQQLSSALLKEFKRYSDKKEKIMRHRWIKKAVETEKINVQLEEKLCRDLRKVQSDFLDEKQHDSGRNSASSRKVSVVQKKRMNGKTVDFLLSNCYQTETIGVPCIKEWIENKPDATLKIEVPLPRVIRRNRREKLAEKAFEDYMAKKRTKLPPKVYHEDYVQEEIIEPQVESEDLVGFYEREEIPIDLVTVLQRALRGLAAQKRMLELIEDNKDGLSISLSAIYPGIKDT